MHEVQKSNFSYLVWRPRFTPPPPLETRWALTCQVTNLAEVGCSEEKMEELVWDPAVMDYDD